LPKAFFSEVPNAFGGGIATAAKMSIRLERSLFSVWGFFPEVPNALGGGITTAMRMPITLERSLSFPLAGSGTGFQKKIA
jgi:hypothetical protein